MRAVIFANGEFTDPRGARDLLRPDDLIIAADGGTQHALSAGVIPHVIIGDLDSLSPVERARVEAAGSRIIRFSPRKDETDTELALLEAAAAGATRITILGALGGRIDHTLANVLLLLMPQLEGIETIFFDGCSYLSVVRRKGEIRGQVGDLVSLIPLGGDAGGIITEGLEYPLHDETLHIGAARGISNVLTRPKARIAVGWGNLLVVHTPRRYLES